MRAFSAELFYAGTRKPTGAEQRGTRTFTTTYYQDSAVLNTSVRLSLGGAL
ncbi:MAG: hypothetical protein JO159_11395 [Acidobacteria bacterium]|nr:hypothetical protein [Acidobacteriota bacterium]